MMETASDRELSERAASGSNAAFGALFERHASAVYNYCFRRAANWTDAEDLMAATFLEAWRRRDDVLLAHDSLRPWLLGVATNLLRNDMRSRRRRDAALRRVEITPHEESFDETVVAKLDDESRMAEVLQVLSGLSKEDQEVIALVVWSELSYEEAAIALDVAVGTIKSRLSRAKRRVVELTKINGHNNDDGTALARASTTQPREVEG